MSIEDENIAFQFQKAVDRAIDEALQKSFDRHMEEFRAEADSIRAEVIAAAVMKLSSWYTYHDLGHTIRIEVKRPEN